MLLTHEEKLNKSHVEQFNRMRAVLILIGREYRTPEYLRKNAERDYGIDYHQALEMAYENIQETAREAVKGVRECR